MAKLKEKIHPEGIVKGGAQMVAGLGVSTVVYYAVRAVTPPVLRPVEKIAFTLGGAVVESLAYTIAAKHVGEQIDEAYKQTDALMDQVEETQKVRKEKKPKKEKKKKKAKLETVPA